ncbi:MAG: HlyD family efflux transporter periplasmic adaptor subunit, partial [Cucumibacter sp.]
GDRVEVDRTLFKLDQRIEEAELASGQARLAAARAQLEDAMTGRREEELAITERALERARSDLSLARQNNERTSQLFSQGIVPRARLDQDQAALTAAQSAVEELDAQLAVGRLPARPAELDAARAGVEAAEADVRRLEAALADRIVKAPVAGIVDEVYYAAGEQAAPSSPIVAIRPDGAMEVRLFVGESARPSLAPGYILTVNCRGCAETFSAEVIWIASSAQFNPPVIYSRAERSDLVYLVKARPEAGTALTPGQPVEARPAPRAEESPAPRAEESPAPRAQESPAPRAEESPAP